jgi:hypothetical protein
VAGGIEANDSGLSALASLVHPTPADTFLDEFRGRRFFHQAGAPDRFERLLSWSDLNRILDDHRLAPPRLRLARDGGPIAEELYARQQTSRRGVQYAVLEPARLREQLRAGATLVLDSVDQLHAPVRDLAAGLERELGERVQVNLYASWLERQGFGVHWDDHDVLVLQVAGRKRWRVHGMTRQHPLHRDVAVPEPPDGEPVWDGHVEAGAVIHVPRGHWHDAMAGGEPSLHLTVGLIRPTGVDLVEWIADRLRAADACRVDLDRRASPERRRAHAREIREALAAVWSDDVVAEFLEWQDERAQPRPRLSLPWGIVDERLDDGRVLRDNLPRQVPLHRHGRGVELRAHGRSWVFAAETRPMLELAFDGRPHAVGALVALGPPGGAEQRRELLAFLCRQDLLTPLDPS